MNYNVLKTLIERAGDAIESADEALVEVIDVLDEYDVPLSYKDIATIRKARDIIMITGAAIDGINVSKLKE